MGMKDGHELPSPHPGMFTELHNGTQVDQNKCQMKTNPVNRGTLHQGERGQETVYGTQVAQSLPALVYD